MDREPTVYNPFKNGNQFFVNIMDREPNSIHRVQNCTQPVPIHSAGFNFVCVCV